MDDQALEVLKAAKATEDVLAAKGQSLAAVRTEFERKQKEVYTSSVTTSACYLEYVRAVQLVVCFRDIDGCEPRSAPPLPSQGPSGSGPVLLMGNGHDGF